MAVHQLDERATPHHTCDVCAGWRQGPRGELYADPVQNEVDIEPNVEDDADGDEFILEEDDFSDDEDMDVVMALGAGNVDVDNFLMLDGGSDEHCARPSFAAGVPL